MFFVIPDLLSAAEVNHLLTALKPDDFVDGSNTADVDRAIKNNLQIPSSDSKYQASRELIYGALWRNKMMQYFVMPQAILPPTFNRYDAGMYYGDHIDSAVLGPKPGIRGDVSITVFLSSPNEYEGGELVLHMNGQEHKIKLNPGQAIVYPSSTLHRVNKVTRGSRIAAVTAVQSKVRDSAQREMLSDITQVLRFVQDNAPQAPETMKLGKIYNNLLRMWISD